MIPQYCPMQNNIPRHKKILADLGLFYAVTIWGSTFFIVKSALNGIDPVILVAYRFLIAGSILLIFIKFSGRPIFDGWKQALLPGFLLWMLYIPQTIGLQYTTASNSGFITGLFVAFVPLFLRVIFKRKPTMMEVIASAISLIGLWILTGGMSDINIGDILTLITAITYALHLLYVDKFMKRGLDPYLFSCHQFLLVGFLSILSAFIFSLPFEIVSTDAFWMMLFLALFPTLSAFVIQMAAQKIRSALRVSLIFALEPVFAAIFAWTLGGESIVRHRALGGLLIFLALVISGLPVPKKR
ncbi:MAG TPA: hypothetical protein ENL22_08995 [candidate division Zixibacteria bacterium]|nr:hypothetical protein [candidate division Zixibacteria bacterium]